MTVKNEKMILIEATEDEAKIIRDALHGDADRHDAKATKARELADSIDIELTYDGQEELAIFREAVDEVGRVMRGA